MLSALAPIGWEVNSRSRSQSHLSSHLNIISFLFSLSCSSFSLIWKKNAISAHETTPVRRRVVIRRGLASLAQVGIQAARGQWLISILLAFSVFLISLFSPRSSSPPQPFFFFFPFVAFQLVLLWQGGESPSLPEKQLKANERGGRSSYLSRVPVFARQQRSAQLGAVGEFGLAGLDLGADPLVVLLQQLHRRDVPGSKGDKSRRCR